MQRQIAKLYPLVLEICKGLAVKYEDLAHDVIIKLNDDPNILTAKNQKGYIYTVARNLYRTQLKQDRFVELTAEPKQKENEISPDPFYIYEKILEFEKHQEIMGIVLELYYHFEGNVSAIEREMKSKGFKLTRQTFAKYLESAEKEFRKWL